MKFEQLVTSYLALRLVRPPTASTYRYYVRRVTEHTGKESVDDCDLESAIRFRDKLLETSVGVTWNSARRHLIALWKYAESIHGERNWSGLFGKISIFRSKPFCCARKRPKRTGNILFR